MIRRFESRPRPRKHTDATLSGWRDLKLSGLSYAKVAKIVGVTRSTIYRQLHLYTNMYASGELQPPSDYISLALYAEMHEMSLSGVTYHIQRGNLKSMKFNRKWYIQMDSQMTTRCLPDERLESIYTAKDAGFSNRSIAKLTNISAKTVNFYIKELYDPNRIHH